MKEFRRVGSEVTYGDVRVGMDDVSPIHDMLIYEVAEAKTASGGRTDIVWEEDYDKLRLGFFFDAANQFDDNQKSRAVSSILTHYAMNDSWRMVVGIRTFDQSERSSNRHVLYRLEVAGGEVLEAKKEAYFINGDTEYQLGDTGDLIEITRTEKKMYERPLESVDCERIVDLLLRTAKRARVS